MPARHVPFSSLPQRLVWTRSVRSFAACLALFALGGAGCGDDGGGGTDTDDFDWDVFGPRDVQDEPRPDVGPVPDARPDTPPRPPRVVDGEPCSEDDGCRGGSCLEEPAWPGGYCSRVDCADDSDCNGDGARCVGLEEGPRCLAPCRRAAQCREGYTCQLLDEDGGVCVPFVDDPRRVDAEPCDADEDCRGGTCLRGDEWPDGYCTTLGCQRFTDCARGGQNNRCLLQPDQNYCVRDCSQGTDCRDGYVCRPTGGGSGFCAADRTTLVETPDEFDLPFPLTCVQSVGGQVRIDYTIPAGTDGYMIVPFSRDGRTVSPRRVTGPDGLVIDFRGENRFQIIVSSLFPFINPLVVPGAPRHADQLRAGDHTLEVETTSADLCWYLLTRAAPGVVLDVNVHLVATFGREEQELADSPELAGVLDALDDLFAGVGLRVGRIRVVSVAESTRNAFNVLRSVRDVEQLVATSRQPGATEADALSLNIFFVAAFDIPGAPGVLGISAGLPGPAGLHGTPASGVTLAAPFLFQPGSSFALERIVLAHEVGHYLGLFHTTEQDAATFDPLADTPECRGGFPTACADRTNLMFPFADIDHTVVTSDQGAQMRANPMVRSE